MKYQKLWADEKNAIKKKKKKTKKEIEKGLDRYRKVYQDNKERLEKIGLRLMQSTIWRRKNKRVFKKLILEYVW